MDDQKFRTATGGSEAREFKHLNFDFLKLGHDLMTHYTRLSDYFDSLKRTHGEIVLCLIFLLW